MAIESGHALADVCWQHGFKVIEQPGSAITPSSLQASVVTSFEVLEHLYAPDVFLRAIRDLLLPRGVVVFTTLTISGWDMQVFWERSKSIAPPHHLNLLSVEGLTLLVERTGFEIVDVSTPGTLDVDIVRNMLTEDPGLPVPRFTNYLLRRRGAETWPAFQAFLSAHRLSSDVRVVVRRLLA